MIHKVADKRKAQSYALSFSGDIITHRDERAAFSNASKLAEYEGEGGLSSMENPGMLELGME